MMRRALALLSFIALLVPAAARAQEAVVAGMSQNRVSITANFDGSEILIFGAVKRDTPPPPDKPLQVIVTVSGPQKPVTVRRKEHRYGIWINTAAVEIAAAPTFYAVATTGPLETILDKDEDRKYKVSIPLAIGDVKMPEEGADAQAFIQALIRIRTRSGLYQLKPGSVNLSQETLFDTSVALPSALTEGRYTTRILLTRGGRVVDEFRTSIDVRKVGLEKFLYTLAHERPLIYGLFSLFIAIVAGWGASVIFARLKQR